MDVTDASLEVMLTTQEAADFLGMSRPTLVRLLEDGEIPFEMRGRHRRVMLADVLVNQERMRQTRHQALASMVETAEVAGMYEATAGPPPRTR
jgi:excisionase family DNA binding protein